MKKLIGYLVFISCMACNDSDKSKSVTPEKNEIAKDSAVSEKQLLTLGNEKQYVEITSASSNLPVLLFIHGGPGWPQTPHLRYFNSDLTKHMTVVAWEQSGCGKSYINNQNPKNLSLAQIIEDAHELTQILKTRFKKDKIFLAGFSWGSVVGLKLAERYPEDYHAYFAISQVININQNMLVSRKWINDQAKKANDELTIDALKKIASRDTSICKGDLDCFIKQFEYLIKYRGAIYRKESDTAIEKAMSAYDDYRNYDWLGGFMYSAKRLEKDLFSVNLDSVRSLKIPVYFFVGRHDWNVPAVNTEKYFANLNAPTKELVWFENSGHEPLEEEAIKFNQAIIGRVEKLP